MSSHADGSSQLEDTKQLQDYIDNIAECFAFEICLSTFSGQNQPSI